MNTFSINQNMDTCSDESYSNRSFEGSAIANQFVIYFYQTWITNPLNFITDEIIKPYSKFTYLHNTYEGMNFIETLKVFVSEGFRFENCKYEIVDSGSRQIYILVTGTMGNNIYSSQFSQSFMIAYVGENRNSPRKWTLMNSILMIK